ncbi:hypothetical protein VTL71DRAFT_5641 [Oculimacula yallundae]|uniref:Uncharacterized protein n=1 Tax=Oculimacula yallundae TaxID=86028 RepID=A0ABR4BZR9_9HELO
MKRAKVSN